MQFSVVERRYIQALGLLSGLCIFFVLSRGAITGTPGYWFLVENLFLAFISLFFAWLLVKWLDRRRWFSWQGFVLTFLWLIFLPNAWYVLTDFIHFESAAEISPLYDIIMFTSLVMCGYTFGFTSLYLVHRELVKRISGWLAMAMVLATILLASFAIYLGRDLRWNTWDLLTNPGGLVVSVWDRVVDPFNYPRSLNVTTLFFIWLSTAYSAIWIILRPSKIQRIAETKIRGYIRRPRLIDIIKR